MVVEKGRGTVDQDVCVKAVLTLTLSNLEVHLITTAAAAVVVVVMRLTMKEMMSLNVKMVSN